MMDDDFLNEQEKVTLNASLPDAHPAPENGHTMHETPEIETPEIETPRQVDAVVALAETLAILLDGILPLIPPYPVQDGDIHTMGRLRGAQEQLSRGMHQLHTLLAAMDSPLVTSPPEQAPPTPPSSGIILPGR